MTDDARAAILHRAQEYCAAQDRKYGGPPPPLTAEDLDASETEIHNHIRRRGQQARNVDGSEK